jgi:hypothetical protein
MCALPGRARPVSEYGELCRGDGNPGRDNPATSGPVHVAFYEAAGPVKSPVDPSLWMRVRTSASRTSRRPRTWRWGSERRWAGR